ncbi:hypothetical protein FPV16_05455 [Methylobacterium sp. W2]|uniref:hypothetical protein n=1 Tax=Methylobacterium sp. W2 TaxID=2598107 RepID=UPI001D0C9EB0|nr:hypothetical protein [Methylobacterium sp. W2]MCC0805675.1 hypothetical protein [Methylobacterium sp. W2]
MAFFSLKDARARSAARSADAARLKGELRLGLGLGENDVLAVNEIACGEPGCADRETIVLVMRVGEPTRALRIARSMDAVEGEDIVRLGAEEDAMRRDSAVPLTA